MIDPSKLNQLLTPTERLALGIAALPRSARSTLDGINGSTPQSRYNARKRAERKLAKARSLPSSDLP